MTKLSLILSKNTLLLQLLNQIPSLDTFVEPNNTDAEEFKEEDISVFTQTELDNLSKTEVFPNIIFLAPQGKISNCENFARKPVTSYSSMQFGADN